MIKDMNQKNNKSNKSKMMINKLKVQQQKEEDKN
jgi:hypothetical protein